MNVNGNAIWRWVSGLLAGVVLTLIAVIYGFLSRDVAELVLKTEEHRQILEAHGARLIEVEKDYEHISRSLRDIKELIEKKR